MYTCVQLIRNDAHTYLGIWICCCCIILVVCLFFVRLELQSACHKQPFYPVINSSFQSNQQLNPFNIRDVAFTLTENIILLLVKLASGNLSNGMEYFNLFLFSQLNTSQILVKSSCDLCINFSLVILCQRCSLFYFSQQLSSISLFVFTQI